jgi:hypothetical protein
MKRPLLLPQPPLCLPPAPLPMTHASIKPIVGAFLGAVLQGDVDTMRELANADYIQHNPFIPTGLEPFIEILPVLAEAGTTAENIRMFEDGNYRLHAQYLAQCRAVRRPRDGVLRHHPRGRERTGRGTLGCAAAPCHGNGQRQNPDRRPDRGHRSGPDRGEQSFGRRVDRRCADGPRPRTDHRLHQRRKLRPAQPVYRGRA